MRKLFPLVLLLIMLFGPDGLLSSPAADLSKNCALLSVYYSVPDNDQRNFADVFFRFGWNNKPAPRILIQFVNRGYSDRKLKFAIKDATSKKMVVLDKIHDSRFGTEMLKANSAGIIWAGPVDSINDSFSLRVWDAAGEEFDKAPISLKDQQ